MSMGSSGIILAILVLKETFVPNTLKTQGLNAELLQLVKDYFDKGVRVSTLDLQPAPWLLKGLQKLEAGEELTEADIERFNQNQ